MKQEDQWASAIIDALLASKELELDDSKRPDAELAKVLGTGDLNDDLVEEALDLLTDSPLVAEIYASVETMKDVMTKTKPA